MQHSLSTRDYTTCEGARKAAQRRLRKDGGVVKIGERIYRWSMDGVRVFYRDVNVYRWAVNLAEQKEISA